MNYNSSGSLISSKTITGFSRYKMAEGLTSHSIDSYARILKKWSEYMGEVELAKIFIQTITGYLSWLRGEYAGTLGQPYTQEEAEKKLKACACSPKAKTNTCHKFTVHRAAADRDQAILLMLLDTGKRALLAQTIY
jgi:site-specific recombinase XerD